MTRRVCIVQELLPHYRVEFFRQLSDELGARGVSFELVHGAATGPRRERRDEGRLESARRVTNRVLTVRGKAVLVWQPAWRSARRADLVIVEQANRLLLTQLLLWLPRSRARVALWGHGANLQAVHPRGVRERYKARAARRADHWFAYTSGTRDRLSQIGVPTTHVSVVNNALDDSAFQGTAPDRVSLRCVYVGALDTFKRIDLLLAACDLVHQSLPAFSLEIVGDGPLRPQVEAWSQERPWCHMHGAQFEEEKARIMQASSLLLMPGLVGLSVVDAFHAGTPCVSIDWAHHSPEVEYLVDGVNGCLLAEGTTARVYAQAVVDLLNDPQRIALLRAGCVETSRTLTLSQMVKNFARGVEDALVGTA